MLVDLPEDSRDKIESRYKKGSSFLGAVTLIKHHWVPEDLFVEKKLYQFIA